jgi:hypothetical protein
LGTERTRPRRGQRERRSLGFRPASSSPARLHCKVEKFSICLPFENSTSELSSDRLLQGRAAEAATLSPSWHDICDPCQTIVNFYGREYKLIIKSYGCECVVLRPRISSPTIMNVNTQVDRLRQAASPATPTAAMQQCIIIVLLLLLCSMKVLECKISLRVARPTGELRPSGILSRRRPVWRNLLEGKLGNL